MGTGAIIGILVAIVVIGVIIFLVTRGGGKEAPVELPEATSKAEREPAKPTKAEAKPAKKEPAKKEPAPKKEPAKKPEKAEPAAAAEASPREEPEGEPAEDSEGDEEPEDESEEEPEDDEEPAEDSEGDEEPEEEEPAAIQALRARTRTRRGASEEDVAAVKKGLKKSRWGFISQLADLFRKKKEIDPGILDEMQELLITADVGVKTSERILEALREGMERNELDDVDRVWEALREQALAILDTKDAGPIEAGGEPTAIIVVGVNGVGKTTTIGKLASIYSKQGHKVVLAAGDTFRAAAVAQLKVWGRRTDSEVVHGKDRADPASVIFDAFKKASESGADVVIADTAGRLHTKANLMEELKKVVRTAEKALGRPVDEILLVLDSTTGQNAIQQAQLFKEAIPVNGLALTKLDGTAKGGVVLGIVDQHQVPVRYIGVGERVEDLREFDARTFVSALFEQPESNEGDGEQA